MQTNLRKPLAVLLALLLLVACLPTALAAEDQTEALLSELTVEEAELSEADSENMVKSSEYMWGGANIVTTFRWNPATDTADSRASVGGVGMHYLGSDRKVAYCIDPGVSSTTNTSYIAGDAANSSLWARLPADKQAAIGLILLYGAPNHLSGSNRNQEFGYECATQVLIWEIIMGLRSPVAPYGYNTSAKVSGGTSKPNALYENVIYSDSSSTADQVAYINAFKAGYQAILNSINSHKSIPSFAAASRNKAPTHAMTYEAATGQYKLNLTDTNGVLSSYAFQGTGVAVSRNGNVLNLSAPLDAIRNSVVLSATGNSLDADNVGMLVWTSPGKQTLMTANLSNNPVTAYFSVKPALIPGMMSIKKLADNGDVEGLRFKIWNKELNTIWYGVSDANGDIYRTDSSYSASEKTYTFEGLVDGTYSMRELIADSGRTEVFPDFWKVEVTNAAGEQTYSHTFTGEELTKDEAGDCVLQRFTLTGLTGGGSMNITIHNASQIHTASVQVAKVNTEGQPLEGVAFLLESSRDGKLWQSVSEGLTDKDGLLLFDELTVREDGNDLLYRLTETATLDGYALLREPIPLGEFSGETDYHFDVTVTNAHSYMLPLTGGYGFAAVPLGILGMLWCAAFFMSRRKENT